ncbi:MAG: M23 family metallopeptidase [Candidatus Taylorbacteria bacterium]|nr:M23 family metallopeptidase [Candidatus Taylorbacteria bacterium]
MLIKTLLLGLILVSLPFEVHAGFTSFVTDLFRATPIAAETTVEPNSQNIILLHAAVNTDPNPSKGVSDIAIVSGTALLSEAGPSGTLADVEDGRINTQISVYVVREGDSLSKIAQVFGVSTNTILWANDMSVGSSIKPGQTLVILPVSGIKYKIKKGDTVEALAKKYKADGSEIRSYNGLMSEQTLAEGDTIIIPDGELATIPQFAISKNGKKIPVSKFHAVGGPYYPGYYMRPTTGGNKSQGLHGYNGIDLAGSVGTSIFAAADGRVIISKVGGWNTGYGNYLVIAHANGTQTLYAHLNASQVVAGQSVTKGQTIAFMGTTGNVTGSHLHFEIRGAVNPF